MGFKSEAQRRYMHKHYPEIAKEWEKTTTGMLPEKVQNTSFKKRARRSMPIKRKGRF